MEASDSCMVMMISASYRRSLHLRPLTLSVFMIPSFAGRPFLITMCK